MDPLFELIKSLSKNEKGYIKKLSSFHQKGEKNKYIQLFDAIEKQKEYDEAALYKKLGYSRSSTAFPVAKNYLYNFVLDGLTSYHGSSVKQEMRRQLDRVEVLHRKGLNDQCNRILSKARKTAMRYDLHENLEEVIDWELLLARERELNEITLKRIDKLYAEWFELLARKKTGMQFRQASDRLVVTTAFRGFVRTEKDLEAFDAVFKAVRDFDEAEFSDPYNLFFLYRSQYLYRHVSGELDLMYLYLQKTQKLLWDNEHFFEARPHVFLISIANKIICELSMRKYSEAIRTLELYEQLVKRKKDVGPDVLFHFMTKKFYVFVSVGYFEEAVQVSADVSALIAAHGSQFKLIDIIHFHNQALGLYLTLGDWKKANRHFQLLLQNLGDMRPDVQAWAHIMGLIIHFEQGDQDLLEYRIKSTYRLLLRRQKMFKVETLILDFIRTKIKSIPSREKQTEAFSQLHDELLAAMASDKYEKSALSNFDLPAWLQSKVTGESFLAIRKRKLQQYFDPQP
jgi:hypothetical protein